MASEIVEMPSNDIKRVLARVTPVLRLESIPDSDNIQLATIMGWQVVVKKGDFAVGDLCVYFSIDAILDKTNPEFRFLKGKRLKTAIIRKTVSQGLAMKLDIVRSCDLDPATLREDDDLTDRLKVELYQFDPEEDHHQSDGNMKLPSGMHKTGEIRVQECHKLLKSLVGKPVCITRKEEGTSTSFYYVAPRVAGSKEHFHVCGRNAVRDRENADKMDAPYFEIADRYHFQEKLRALGRDLIVQGETMGPKINGNCMGLVKNEFEAFYIWNIQKQCKLTWDEFVSVCTEIGVPMVPLIYRGLFMEEWADIQALKKWASSLDYKQGYPCEGFVIATDNPDGDRQQSFKVISDRFLLKWGR